jgi:hypothetical protein
MVPHRQGTNAKIVDSGLFLAQSLLPMGPHRKGTNAKMVTDTEPGHGFVTKNDRNQDQYLILYFIIAFWINHPSFFSVTVQVFIDTFNFPQQ